MLTKSVLMRPQSLRPRARASTCPLPLPPCYATATTQQSMVGYRYVRRCDCRRYVDRTSLSFRDKINQNIPKSIRNNQKPTKIFTKRNWIEKLASKYLQCDLEIGLYLLQDKECANNYNDQLFSIFARARFQHWN